MNFREYDIVKIIYIHHHLIASIPLFQEANTEKIFYGLDDIDGASDIIIVRFFSLENHPS